ncbi:amidase family protein [Bacillus sp. FJAT-26390]|uniref:amidase family protein n=1 Tax=Bacillus sp. FJAT-26390 TaxID=1743142 RepID=UPI000807D7FE|nr:amidase family protein [Bacillus sp. FJAT-26390]OBZ13744.1 amidase [Bacillus sp. FJAT-26390]
MKVNMEEWIIEADIASMQAAMEAGWLSSEELVKVYLGRIKRHDGVLRSILEVNPDAIEIARDLDQERVERGSRGNLHGIPIILKDNIDTHDNMHTSAGSVALANSYAAADSFVASQLRAAGAVFLGKANMTEWANFMSGSMWAGYSSRGGLVLNPYGPGELFIGGSSSGSGAAAAANLAAAAIGTETSGSIISPASQTNLVGIKPTIGLVSRTGIIPITSSQDTAGPMARTVTDAAIVLGALTGADELDEVTVAGAKHAYKDYTPFLNTDYLKQARIGIPRFYYKDLDEARLAVIEEAIGVLKQAGATIIDPVELPCEKVEWDWHVLRYEFKKYINDYLGKLDESVPVHSLQELIAYNAEHADIALKYGQDTLISAEETSGTLTEQEYVDSLIRNRELAGKGGIDHALEEHQLDALLFLGNDDGDDLAARAGYPVITVPGGFAETGIIAEGGYTTKGPQGISFIGTAFSEPTLIKLAYGFEQATKHRFPPTDFS